jgi:2-hydroxy-3-oxopropionate reductase
MRVGVIGLGVMGMPMARNLLAAGFELTALSRSPEPVDAIVAAGADRGSAPAGVAAAGDVTILMLPDDARYTTSSRARAASWRALAPGTCSST